ncbi:hypothetical protein FHW36_101726 [Chitinophaga polysaccharea]|uniref:Endosialidase-like protein n=1 Tax=Chitinophaga polysaccharea TaxID=1293035 RepID=A0A561Q362_9BACT|nr:hypothetical protein [Chitinophaga polysaccharea]TWF44804.1 hypothetical protein FHW36_101726 [Chitinophaga polysaccharea]
MKSLFVTLLFLFACITVIAQNALPAANGYIGIGTAAPTSRLHVLDNNRNYYVDRGIPGISDDNITENYILLHVMYIGTILPTDYHVMGRFSAVRGSSVGSNRKWIVDVNTASAYNRNIGSLVSFSDRASLVTLTYNSVAYLAVSIPKMSTLYNFSFTGYAQNDSFRIVRGSEVTDVNTFNATEEIGIQGAVVIKNAATSNRLVLSGIDSTYSNIIAVTHTAIPNSQLYIGNATSSYPVITQRNANIIESYRDLHIGAANSGKIIFENGRNGTTIGSSMVIANNKNVGIGVDNPAYKLTVDGTIGARRVKVTQEQWADYVFHPNYKLPALATVSQFIKDNKHLPDIPSEKEVKERGVDLGEMNKLYLQKIEELTLYIIDLQRQVDALKENTAKFMKENNQ